MLDTLEWICAFALVIAGAVACGIFGYVFIDVIFYKAKTVRGWIATLARRIA